MAEWLEKSESKEQRERSYYSQGYLPAHTYGASESQSTFRDTLYACFLGTYAQPSWGDWKIFPLVLALLLTTDLSAEMALQSDKEYLIAILSVLFSFLEITIFNSKACSLERDSGEILQMKKYSNILKQNIATQLLILVRNIFHMYYLLKIC